MPILRSIDSSAGRLSRRSPEVGCPFQSWGRLLALLALACCDPLSAWAQGDRAAPRVPVRWTAVLQTGLAESFQLTLGGTFGAGPAWQSRLEAGVSHLWSNNDSLYVFGVESLDLPCARSDWQVGMEYRRPLWGTAKQQLTGTAGFQHWKFANVKTGANDWLIHENLTYRNSAGRVGFLVTSDAWNLLASPLPAGSLVHTQAWAEHSIWKRESLAVSFRHGPAHTYSWGFYNTRGHRVIRYQTMLGVGVKGTRIEIGWRKQFGLQPGIPDNPFWQFSISRTILNH